MTYYCQETDKEEKKQIRKPECSSVRLAPAFHNGGDVHGRNGTGTMGSCTD